MAGDHNFLYQGCFGWDNTFKGLELLLLANFLIIYSILDVKFTIEIVVQGGYAL